MSTSVRAAAKPAKVHPKAAKSTAKATEPTAAAAVLARELRAAFSYNLRMARLSVRMTQRELAKASGISQKHISLIELSAPNIGIDVLAALAYALPGVTPADLLKPLSSR